jgi:hypothetical protein
LSGSILSIVLFYLAPLPILMAGIGWSHWAALIASFFAALTLAVIFGGFFFVAFSIGIGLPAWWLAYLALLARPLPDTTDLEWYPVGRIVVWAAILGAVIVAATIPSFGWTVESFNAALRAALEKLFRAQLRTPAGTPLENPGADTKRLLDLLVVITPLGIAVVSTVINLVNVWLAARVVKVSGRLRRPWPALPQMQFAPYTPALLAAAIVGSFMPGLTGLVGGILAVSLFTAYAVLGFAVLHAITVGIGARAIILTIAYLAASAVYWVAFGVALIGLADTIFDIRGKHSARRGPPAPTIR